MFSMGTIGREIRLIRGLESILSYGTDWGMSQYGRFSQIWKRYGLGKLWEQVFSLGYVWWRFGSSTAGMVRTGGQARQGDLSPLLGEQRTMPLT